MKKYKYVDPIHSVSYAELANKSVQFWPTGNPFEFEGGFHSPKNLIVNYQAVRNALSKAGLTCDQNNDDNVGTVINRIRTSAPTYGYNMKAATHENPPEYHYQIVEQVGWSSMMNFMLKKHKEINDNDLYPVHHDRVTRSYQQSSLVLLGDLFTAIGKIVGDLDNGFVNIDQLVKTIAKEVEVFPTEQTDNYHASINDKTTFFVSIEKDSDQEAKAIAGSIYNYSMEVEDYKDKKYEYHACSYHVEQWSMFFTDSNIMCNLYHELGGPETKGCPPL